MEFACFFLPSQERAAIETFFFALWISKRVQSIGPIKTRLALTMAFLSHLTVVCHFWMLAFPLF